MQCWCQQRLNLITMTGGATESVRARLWWRESITQATCHSNPTQKKKSSVITWLEITNNVSSTKCVFMRQHQHLFLFIFFLSNHRTAWMFSSEEVTGLFRHLFTTTLILWIDLVMPNDWFNVDIQRLSCQSPLLHSLLLVSGNTPWPVASCCLWRYCTTLLSWGLETQGLQGFTKYVLGLHFPEFLKNRLNSS